MTKTKSWSIPDDWGGTDWECYSIQWPASEGFRRLLVSLLYALTRGREWNEETGRVVDAQKIGWQIFDRNVPLALCGTGGETIETPNTIEYRGGSLIVIGEDEMGQVVTEVKVDPETGELLIYYGRCCVERLSFAAGDTPIVDTGVGQFGEDVTPDDDGIEWPETPTETDPGYTLSRCPMAHELVDRLYAIAEAAWNARTTPGTIADAVRDANPGYTVSMRWATNLWMACQGMAVIELFGDTDIFSGDMKRAWRCHLWGLLRGDGGDKQNLSKTEWVEFVVFPFAYPFYSEWPDLGLGNDVAVADFWRAVCNLVGRERANQIMYESIGQTADCADCLTGAPDDGAADEATEPDDDGFYASVPLGGVMTRLPDSGSWDIYYRRDVSGHNVYGAVVGIQCNEAFTSLKRMNWENTTEGAWEDLPVVDFSLTASSSDTLGEYLTAGQEHFFIMVDDDDVAASIAEGLGLTTGQWTRLSPDGNYDTNPLATEAAIGSLVGVRFDASDQNNGKFTWTSYRFVYNTNDGTH